MTQFMSEELSAEVREVLTVVAEDLLQLAALHGAEPSRDRLEQLIDVDFPANLGFKLESDSGQEALRTLRQGITGLPAEIGAEVLDTLAVDYADIYLNYTFGVSPCESVWIDEENLALQAPRFQVREFYQRFSLQAKDWRRMSEDHLVLQLEFLSYLCREATDLEWLNQLATFLDEHPLRWVPKFADKVTQRAATRYFVGLAQVTASLLDELRSFLEVVLDAPRPTAAEVDARLKARMASESAPLVQISRPAYVPGAEPSW